MRPKFSYREFPEKFCKDCRKVSLCDVWVRIGWVMPKEQTTPRLHGSKETKFISCSLYMPILGLFRETEPIIHIYFENWAPPTVEDEKPHDLCLQAGDPGNGMVEFSLTLKA